MELMRVSDLDRQGHEKSILHYQLTYVDGIARALLVTGGTASHSLGPADGVLRDVLGVVGLGLDLAVTSVLGPERVGELADGLGARPVGVTDRLWGTVRVVLDLAVDTGGGPGLADEVRAVRVREARDVLDDRRSVRGGLDRDLNRRRGGQRGRGRGREHDRGRGGGRRALQVPAGRRGLGGLEGPGPEVQVQRAEAVELVVADVRLETTGAVRHIAERLRGVASVAGLC